MAGGREAHPGHSAVVGVALAPHQLQLLQARHDAGHGGGTDPLDGRELSEGQRTETVEAREGGQLRRSDPLVGLLAETASQPHDGQAQPGGDRHIGRRHIGRSHFGGGGLGRALHTLSITN